MASYAFSRLFDYKALAMHYPAVKSEVREQPLNLTSIQNIVTGNNKFAIRLPQIENSFYLPSTFAFNFRITYNGVANTMKAALLGNALSHFSRIICVGEKDGVEIDSIDSNNGMLHNMLANMSMSHSEQECMQGWGKEVHGGSSNFGRLIQGTDAVHSYSIPLLSMFSMSNQAIPAFLTSFKFEFTMEAIANIMQLCSDEGATLPTSYTIDQISISVDTVRFENDAMSVLLQTYPSISLKTTGYRYSNAALAAGSSGRLSIPFQHSCVSLKEVFMYATVGDSVDKLFGGVGICRSFQLIINGSRRLPVHPVNALNPAELLRNIAICFDSYSSTNCASSITRKTIRSINATDGEMKEYIKTAGAPSVADMELGNAQAGEAKANKCYYAVDCEVLSSGDNSSLYTGINCREGTNTIELDIHTALPAPVVLHIWSSHDRVVSFDTQANQVIVVS